MTDINPPQLEIIDGKETLVAQPEEGVILTTGMPKRKPIFWESMTQASDGNSGARIRVWRRESECPEFNDVELQLTINKIPGHASMNEVFEIIGSLERVTAIELVDPNGNGAVAYYEW